MTVRAGKSARDHSPDGGRSVEGRDTQMESKPRTPEIRRLADRRQFLLTAAAGTAVGTFGLSLLLRGEDDRTRAARREVLPDGRHRLPPGQRLVRGLHPMGGREGDPSPARFRLKVHGAVAAPFEIDFAALLDMEQVLQTCDVHCVTGWSLLDSHWTGVRVRDLARRARPLKTARHVIFEAAQGYTSNVPAEEALRPNVLVAHKLEGDPLPLENGPPVRALVPHLYFWKSAKWLTGIRFTAEEELGYWEMRGYHAHGDPWKEERYG